MSESEEIEGNGPYQILSPDGTAHLGRAEIGLKDADLRKLLRLMCVARALDDECVRMHTDGELLVYPPLRGQEAAQVGSAFALARNDFVFPSFREMAVALVRGVDPVEYLQYHRGTWHGGPYDPIANRFAPICVPLANQIVHAVGYAIGMKMRRRSVVTVAYFGDGSASEGDFHEACNWVSVHRAPVVLLCQNNRWAISVPFEEQAAAPIWTRARGYGFSGVQVDGNDVLAVLQVTKEAAARARAGGGPTLIEALTYRMGPHLTNDEPSRYRSDDEVGRWQELDPIERFRTYLLTEGTVSEKAAAAMDSAAVAFAREIRLRVAQFPPAGPDEVFEWVFDGPTLDMLRQQHLASPRAAAAGPTEALGAEPPDG